MKKAFFVIAILLMVAIEICSSGSFFRTVSSDIIDLTMKQGFHKDDFTVVYEEDDHGGFNGDGQYCLVLDCSHNKEKALRNVEDWKRLPLPKELEIILYGGEYDGSNYSSSFPDEVEIPPITNGYYYFEDRHSESTDKDNPSGLLDRYSYNFEFAVYDADRDILYGIKEDT